MRMVWRISGPLKGMQRELKGFQKEMAGLAIGAAAAGTAVLGALALPVNAAIGFESKMADCLTPVHRKACRHYSSASNGWMQRQMLPAV
ncbi:hypothetical protein HT73_003253 [Salmonella enterica subsp. enterica serovar Miami]|nr:hypothetical protein [Salmonella enterica subsp. enterica serovar Miami]